MQLFDNLSRTLKEIKSSSVKIYVCGPTVYDDLHLGHGRVLIVFDFLNRICREIFSQVTFVQNITDIDDKILAKAEKLNQTPQEVSTFYTEKYFAMREMLNVLEPDASPKATEYIQEMQNYIKVLLEKDLAYVNETGIYFDTSKIKYDFFEIKTSSQSRLISREKLQEQDFALWKFYKGGLNFFPYGTGRPGWHIECSAMSQKLLGEEFTIHGGGSDLKFPHHCNEIAQSVGFCGKIPAEIWMHNEMINIEGNKMSKSLDNFTYLSSYVTDSFFADVMRYFYLSYHYSTPIEISSEKIELARQNLEQIRAAYFKSIYGKKIGFHKDILNYIENDLPSPQVIQTLHKYIAEQQWEKLHFAIQLCGFKMQSKLFLAGKRLEEIEEKVAKRQNARKTRDYILADKYREELKEFCVFEDGQNIWYPC